MFKGSRVGASDNSGVISAKIIQTYSRKLNPVGVKCLAVLRIFDPFKKQLQKKKKYGALVVAAKQSIRRKNGSCIRFNSNKSLFFADKDFDKFISTRVFGPVGREIILAGLNSLIRQKIDVGCSVL